MQRHAHCCPSVPPRVMSCSQALRKHQSRLIQVLDPAQELGSKKPSAESQEHHFSLVRSVRDPGGRVGTAQTEGTSQDPSDPSVQHTHRAKKAKHEQALDVLVKGEVATAFLFVWQAPATSFLQHSGASESLGWAARQWEYLLPPAAL